MKRSFLLYALFVFSLNTACGQSSDHQKIEEKVEELRQLLVSPDQSHLEKITSRELSYGHSSGTIESQQQFIDFLLSGKSKFVSIELQDQSINIVGNNGIVRHTLVAETNNEGETVNIKLGVLLVWQKEGEQWKLLARQAFKL